MASESQSTAMPPVRADNDLDAITGTLMSCQGAHIIWTCRGSTEEQRDLRARIESCVDELNVVYGGGKFLLDMLASLISLDIRHHAGMEKGHFLITPSLDVLNNLEETLDVMNSTWLEEFNKDKTAKRGNLPNSLLGVPDLDYELVIMHHTQPPHSLNNCVIPSPDGGVRIYQVQPDGSFRYALDAPHLPPRPLPPTQRAPEDIVNPVFTVLYNRLRFKRHEEGVTWGSRPPITFPRYLELVDRTIAVYDKLFFRPEDSGNLALYPVEEGLAIFESKGDKVLRLLEQLLLHHRTVSEDSSDALDFPDASFAPETDEELREKAAKEWEVEEDARRNQLEGSLLDGRYE